MFLIPIPLLPIAILLVLYFGVVQHFWLFLFTVGPVACCGHSFCPLVLGSPRPAPGAEAQFKANTRYL